eukprot:1095888-Rhodomonas_salina.1
MPASSLSTSLNQPRDASSTGSYGPGRGDAPGGGGGGGSYGGGYAGNGLGGGSAGYGGNGLGGSGGYGVNGPSAYGGSAGAGYDRRHQYGREAMTGGSAGQSAFSAVVSAGLTWRVMARDRAARVGTRTGIHGSRGCRTMRSSSSSRTSSTAAGSEGDRRHHTLPPAPRLWLPVAHAAGGRWVWREALRRPDRDGGRLGGPGETCRASHGVRGSRNVTRAVTLAVSRRCSVPRWAWNTSP